MLRYFWAMSVALAISMVGGPIVAQSTPNEVFVELTLMNRYATDEDQILNQSLTWERSWFFNVINNVDDSHAPVNGLAIDVQRLNGGQFTGWWPDDPTIFTGSAASPRWNFAGVQIPEAATLFGVAREQPETILQAPALSVSRSVSPLALSGNETLQVVTATVRFDAPLPNENWVGVFMGASRLAFGPSNLVESEFVSSVAAPSPWIQSSVNGILASWFTTDPSAIIGQTYTFQATLKSIKSPQLLGAPLFKPNVFLIRERLTNLGKVLEPVSSILLTDLGNRMTATYTTDRPVRWDRVLSDHRFDTALNPVVSRVISDPPFVRVVVPATVRIEPETVNLRAKGVISAFIELQAPYRVVDIDTASLSCAGARSQHASVANQRLVAQFRIADLQGLVAGSSVPLTVEGRLRDGSVFSAQDVVRVIR